MTSAAAAPLAPAASMTAGTVAAGDATNDEVGRAREIVEARGRALPADHGRARVDEVDAAGKARRAQVAQDGKADRTFAVARPDKRDGGWREQLVETVRGHNGRSALSLCRRGENEAVPTRLQRRRGRE